ncbi:MAG: glycosyltransferase [Gammaproteobacteria bacterium]|nr:glycosyltransferase [Gammaproteobacteria bacterium]MBU2676736.1 glycosyltransferase [Gammaproteobacteria bacterium]NNC57828.1 glycosyltransferase family 2 protein [Woeseiaceae bacterium]NNL50471.1 glycosyltransferase family 2 protein [Woeseiaceae bacterium]
MNDRRTETISAVACASLEIGEALPHFEGLDKYHNLRILPRWKSWPLAPIELPVRDGRVEAAEIRSALIAHTAGEALRNSVAQWLSTQDDTTPNPHDLFTAPDFTSSAAMISVVVCTRDRSEQLKTCLKSLAKLNPAPLEVVVVDNAPSDESTKVLVHEAFPDIAYVRETRPGLDWARNAGADQARGEIIAYTDDDVAVDIGWAGAIADAFNSAADIMAMTGLVEPAELDTEAQQLFEYNGGFGRGCTPRWVRVPSRSMDRWGYYGAGQYGTGANMAFRRKAFECLGGFDTALDVGTLTNGGGDIEMLARVLANGNTLCYWPAAIVFHYHRRDHVSLYRQLENNGRGSLAMFLAMWLRAPAERGAISKLMAWWSVKWLLKPSLKWVFRRKDFRNRLRARELKGTLLHPFTYFQARKRARQIERDLGPVRPWLEPKTPSERRRGSHSRGVAQREIDISRPLKEVADAVDYDEVDILVRKKNSLLGMIRIAHNGRAIGRTEIAYAVADWFGPWVFAADPAYAPEDWETTYAAAFRGHFSVAAPTTSYHHPESMFVSVVLATLDRPDDLRRCLQSLQCIETRHQFEIVVVDNNPISGLSEKVVADFESVRYVPEERRGLSYARNAGIRAAQGEIIVATDDDVIVPPNWLDELCRPFLDPTVAGVTGNVLPLTLDDASERRFEEYGGLGRGFARRTFDYRWLGASAYAAETWEIGATANAAFRSELFTDRRVGLLDEALGAGMPTGCSEDTYLFYRILMSGKRIVYEPSAYVRHKHRVTPAALRKQLFSYSKGHVAYLLTTWRRDGDRSALRRMMFVLPRWHAGQMWRALKSLLCFKAPAYPLHLTFVEIAGHFMGPIALMQARRRVQRNGRSGDAVADGVSFLKRNNRSDAKDLAST